MNQREMLQRLANGEPPLEVSIQKWQDIVDGTGVNESCENCALCESDKSNEVCSCIIKIKAGVSCRDTPYYAYTIMPCKDTAQAELDFLKSLREVTP